MKEILILILAGFVATMTQKAVETVIKFFKGDDYDDEEEEEEEENSPDMARVYELAAMGQDKHSFYYHALAYCEENRLEAFTPMTGGREDQAGVFFWIDGENSVRVYTNEKEEQCICINNALVIMPQDSVIDDAIEVVSGRHPDVRIYIEDVKSQERRTVVVECTMEADPTEPDARLYIPSFVSNVLLPVKNDLRKEYFDEAARLMK